MDQENKLRSLRDFVNNDKNGNHILYAWRNEDIVDFLDENMKLTQTEYSDLFNTVYRDFDCDEIYLMCSTIMKQSVAKWKSKWEERRSKIMKKWTLISVICDDDGHHSTEGEEWHFMASEQTALEILMTLITRDAGDDKEGYVDGSEKLETLIHTDKTYTGWTNFENYYITYNLTEEN